MKVSRLICLFVLFLCSYSFSNETVKVVDDIDTSFSSAHTARLIFSNESYPAVQSSAECNSLCDCDTCKLQCTIAFMIWPNINLTKYNNCLASCQSLCCS